MAKEVQEALQIVEDIVNTLKKTQVNLKKCPKARLTRNYIETRLKCIDEHWEQYKQAHADIIRGVPKEKRDLVPHLQREDFYEHEEIYISLKTEMMDILTSGQPTATPPLVPSDMQNTRVVLPKIQLPTYSGHYEEWLSFHDLFNSLVHNNTSLTNVQKLHYLKTSLSGEAALIVKHIQVADSNYEQAWELLKSRYGNKRMNINAIMKRLFSQKRISTNTSNQIKNLLDTTFECLHHLNNLQLKTENWDPFIIFLIVQKLDADTHKCWEEYVSNHCDDPDVLPSLEMCRKFLENQFRTLELVEPSRQKANLVHVKEKTFHAATNIEKSKTCVMCNENHTLSHCKEFGKHTPTQRSDYIKKNHLCFNCLASGHSVRQCRVPMCCRICKRRHHSLLHENREKHEHVNETLGNTEMNIQPHVALHSNVERIEEEDITMLASHVVTKQSTALLATAVVKVRTENHTTTLRALIDPGSQASFISERAAQLLQAKRYSVKGTVVGVGSTKEDIKHVVQLYLESKCEDFSMKIKTYVMSKQLTTKIPSQHIHTKSWPHLHGLVLADPDYNKPGPIDLLLGVDVYAQIIQPDLIKGLPGSPCAHKTNLGWILFGRVEDKPQSTAVVVMHHQLIEEDFLKTLWEVDKDLNRKHTKEEQLCETTYEDTYTRNSEGRYVVKLPFRYDEPLSPNGNTRHIALKRLLQHEKRLNNSPELKEEYDQVLEEYLFMGHMEEVPQDELSNKSVYLPHHAVIRRDKDTTKIRVVFDASSKGDNNISLNDELLVGPVLQDDLRSIVMRWRMYKFCFVSDVVKMYRMVLLHKEHIDYHRILWRRKPNHSENNSSIECKDNISPCKESKPTNEEDVKDYRLRTVTFGTASAPYLAIKTLMKISEDEGSMYPEATRIIREDTYVDDVMSGADTVEQTIQLSQQVIYILQRGGFELQKWASNSADFLKSLCPDKISAKASFDMKLDGMIKALGLTWNIGKDEFQYLLQLEPMSQNITKRTILSDLQRLFDPLGWIAPAIVTAKILVQKLWLEGTGWDEELSNQLKEEWEAIREDLKNVSQIKVPRWLNTLSSEKEQISLHGFCDASEKAYAAVVYCRVVTKLDGVQTHLIAARTKVAPVKTITLPRLELSGATLLAKLLHKVSQAMRVPNTNVFAWTDSTIVLAWLSGEPNRWKPFVANRVVDILEQISSTHWYHVQSACNPADLASRGMSISELQQRDIWWHGPKWLRNETTEFTKPFIPPTDIEKKKLKIQSYINIVSETKAIKYENYDSLTELLRVIAHCKRFLNMKRDPEKLEQHITTEEIQNALDICIKQSQEEEFLEDLTRLKEDKTVRKYSCLKTLSPYIDEKGIMRVGGRLRNAKIDETMKHPVILGKRNKLVMLMISDAHLKTMHGGINLMVTYLMSKYWIVGCKSLVKQHIHKCLTCARQRAASRQQIMGDLPESRVTPSRPFSRCGVDFAGPLHVLNHKGRGAKTSKAYICIFICMAVKAIHLELVSDLTSDAFIAAFKRFVSRRGRCHEIWSDNGTNFVASNKELAAMFKESQLNIPGDVSDQLANNGTQWHFIPKFSPTHGGLWEAGVKSVKQHLRKTLTSNLTFEEFVTVLTQIEACLNSRPLIPVNTNVDLVDDIQVLTPGHFLTGEALVTVPDRDYSNANINLLSRWQHTQRLVQGFWKRWQTEYLSRLNQRPKWLKRTPEFEIGDIVLLKNENMAPSKWALARIVKKHPGHDNITRVYSLRYNGKITTRSVLKICPLPISVNE